MSAGDLSFQNLTSSGSTYQPSGSTVYKILWCGIGGQSSNAAMILNGSEEVLLWKNDGSVTWYNGIGNGAENSNDFTNAQQNAPYISNTWYIKLESACSGNRTFLMVLMEMES